MDGRVRLSGRVGQVFVAKLDQAGMAEPPVIVIPENVETPGTAGVRFRRASA